MKSPKKTSTSHKYAELLKLASFYKRTQPNVRALDLLKMMGFEVKGLERRFGAFLPNPRPHALVWNPTLKWALCLCGTWELVEIEEATAIYQHKIHARMEGAVAAPLEISNNLNNQKDAVSGFRPQPPHQVMFRLIRDE